MENMLFRWVPITFMGVVLTIVIPQWGQAESLTYQGSATIGETVMPEAVKVFEERTGVVFDEVGITGSSDGFKAVMSGEAALGGMSRRLKRAEKRKRPYYRIIGYDGNTVYVHESNPVTNLSKNQLKGIFSGEITNWKDVGGKDAPIVVLVADKAHGTVQSFQKAVLKGAKFHPTKEFPNPSDCVRYVVDHANAITNAPMAFTRPGVKITKVDGVRPTHENVSSGRYPLSRTLLLVTKGLPQGNVQKFFNFMLSAEGQKIVAKHFVRAK